MHHKRGQMSVGFVVVVVVVGLKKKLTPISISMFTLNADSF